ncbi:MAG: hypothetical protein U0326_41200 [Polyangiales bacterium]
MKNPPSLTKVREALARAPRVAVKVALDSGACWAFAVRVDERRGDARVHIDLAGARVVLTADRVLEVAP